MEERERPQDLEAMSHDELLQKTSVKYISPLVSNNYRWGVEIPALHTVSNKPPHSLW